MKAIPKIEGKKYALNNSYFKNRKAGYPDSLLEIVRYRAQYGELPFDCGDGNWLYEAMTERQKRYGVQNSQYLTPEKTAARIAGLTNNFLPGGNLVLDACCGTGQLTKYLLENKLDVSGFDNDPDMVEICRLTYPQARFELYDFRDNESVRYYDLIVSNPPYEQKGLVSFWNWLSSALSDQGRAVLLIPKGYMNKERPQLLAGYLKRFEFLHREDMREPFIHTKSICEICIAGLTDAYKEERRIKQKADPQLRIIDNNNNKSKPIKEQLMESEKVFLVAIDKISANPGNSRKKFNQEELNELAHSIREHGLLHPVTLRPKGDGYEIVYGERRYRAFKLNGETRIPATVRDYSDEQVLEITLVENINRMDLTLPEESAAYHKLMDTRGYGIEDLCLKFGRTGAYIRGRLRLQSLIPAFRDMLEKEALAVGASMELSNYSAPIQQEVYEMYYKDCNSPASWASIRKKELASRLVKRYAMSLDDYGFNKDACRICLHNTDTSALFDEFKGKCTDLECLRGKQREYMLEVCKSRVGDACFEVIVSPSDRLPAETAEKLREEGIEVKTSAGYESPEAPRKPRRKDFRLDCDYRDALDRYKQEALEYNAEMDEYEKKVESGDYKRCLHIGGNTPRICYTPVKKESRGKTLGELEERARANYETTRANIIRASLDLIRARGTAPTAFSVLEEEIFLFLMLGYVSKRYFPLLGIAGPAVDSLTDKQKETVITGITHEQYGILKREFILRSISQLNTGKLSPKFQLYLQSFAQQHFPEEASAIVKKYLDIYTKSKEKIEKEIRKLRSEPSVPAES